MWWTMFPGYPGPLNANQSMGGVAPVAVPLHPNGALAAGGGPLDGLRAYGVPVGYSPNGTAMLRAGGLHSGAMPMLPPVIAGMPNMPGTPDGFLTGQMGSGGLMAPAQPVRPFDASNQVRQHGFTEHRPQG